MLIYLYLTCQNVSISIKALVQWIKFWLSFCFWKIILYTFYAKNSIIFLWNKDVNYSQPRECSRCTSLNVSVTVFFPVLHSIAMYNITFTDTWLLLDNVFFIFISFYSVVFSLISREFGLPSFLLLLLVLPFIFGVIGKILKMLTICQYHCLESHLDFKGVLLCMPLLLCTVAIGKFSLIIMIFPHSLWSLHYLFCQIYIPVSRIILKLNIFFFHPFIHVASFLIIHNNP